MSEKISVTEEQFLQTVDKWMYLATGKGEPVGCGFCDALAVSVEGCDACQAYHLCQPKDSPFERWLTTRDKVERKQASLEMLQGLFELGVKLGFYKEE